MTAWILFDQNLSNSHNSNCHSLKGRGLDKLGVKVAGLVWVVRYSTTSIHFHYLSFVADNESYFLSRERQGFLWDFVA